MKTWLTLLPTTTFLVMPSTKAWTMPGLKEWDDNDFLLKEWNYEWNEVFDKSKRAQDEEIDLNERFP